MATDGMRCDDDARSLLALSAEGVDLDVMSG